MKKRQQRYGGGGVAFPTAVPLWGMPLLAMVAPYACQPDESPPRKNASLQQIIGQNDLTPVGRESLNSSVVRAIGRMNRGCTVSHLGQGLAITAGHCFARDGFAEDCSAEAYDIVWGLTYDSEGLMHSSCKRLLAAEYNGERDYALFLVDPVPDDALEVASGEVQVGDSISILSHPRKRPLEWSHYCIMEGYFPDSNDQKIAYDCDTEKGSSGAPILNQAFEIVGIHNSYKASYDLNSGTSIAAIPYRLSP